MEEFAYILDYLIHGRPSDRRFKSEPVVLALGDREFKLFELVPKPNANLVIGDRVYIGSNQEKREHIAHVKRRISYTDLTNTAQVELPHAIYEAVMKNEDRFIDFFNKADSLTPRFHALELLPGLGKKTMWAILEERKKRPFSSFQDLEERIRSLHAPARLLAKRIEQELSDPEVKYAIFVSR